MPVLAWVECFARVPREGRPAYRVGLRFSPTAGDGIGGAVGRGLAPVATSELGIEARKSGLARFGKRMDR